MAQRHSDPQIIAEAIDNVIPILRNKFSEDGQMDDQENTLLDYFIAVSNRALHVAERSDLAESIRRIGLNERNLRRIRDISATPEPAIPDLIEFRERLPSGNEAA